MKKGLKVILIIAAGALAAAAALGAAYRYSAGFKSWVAGNVDGGSSGASDGSVDSSGGLSTKTAPAGIAVRLLSTGADASGHVTKTFAYSVAPSDATDQDVALSAGWTDPSVEDAFADCLTAALDQAAKTVTVACLRAFSHQATVRLASDWDARLTATVTVDYDKKFLGFNAAADAFGDSFGLDLSSASLDFGASGILARWQAKNPSLSKGYSVFSKDVSLPIAYSVAVSSAALSAYILDDHEAIMQCDPVPASYAGVPALNASLLAAAQGSAFAGASAVSLVHAWASGSANSVKTYLYSYDRLGFLVKGTVTASCSGLAASGGFRDNDFAPIANFSFAIPATGVTAGDVSIEF